MRRTDGTGRSTSLAATATTLLALAALAAVAPSVRGVPVARAVPAESAAMRAVVAVVAAAARDLLAGQPTVAVLPAAQSLKLACSSSAVAVDRPDDAGEAGRMLLAERMLDLPPPRC